MTAPLPAGYTARAPRPDEVEKVYELIYECELADFGTVDNSLADLRDSWTRPKFNLANDALLVLDPAGKIAGYAHCSELFLPIMVGNAHTSPALTGQGIGSFLVGWLEERMKRQIPTFGPEMEIVFANYIATNNEAARNLLVGRGYRQVREFWHMQILMAAPPETPVWPQGITVRPMVRGQDDRLIYDVYEEVFRDHWGHIKHPYEDFTEWHYERDKFDPSVWFLAFDDATGELAGYSLCTTDVGLSWVNNLGVRRPYRRSGLGLALLRHSFVELYRRGFSEVRLVVDGQSLTGATRLYTGAGMKPILKYARFEKIVRPGLSTGVKELAE